jgi:hypothetical protein
MGTKTCVAGSIRQACAKDAEARAVVEVNVPALTAYAERKLGNHPPLVLPANKRN